MTQAALKVIADGMRELGLDYAFMRQEKDPSYPYYTGEYQEQPPLYENGMTESTFIITGFGRGTWLELENDKEKVENYFNKVSGKTVMTAEGAAVAVFYSHSLVVPTLDAELKKIQINLDVKEWSVI